MPRRAAACNQPGHGPAIGNGFAVSRRDGAVPRTGRDLHSSAFLRLRGCRARQSRQARASRPSMTRRVTSAASFPIFHATGEAAPLLKRKKSREFSEGRRDVKFNKKRDLAWRRGWDSNPRYGHPYT